MSEMTMVEVVARALIERIGSPWRYEDMDPSIKRLWQGHARAAMAAMRVPSAPMLVAVTEMWQQRLRRKVAAGTIGQCHPHETFTENWQAMIDAALRESPGEPQEALR